MKTLIPRKCEFILNDPADGYVQQCERLALTDAESVFNVLLTNRSHYQKNPAIPRSRLTH
jgi:hypothetical protein